MLVQKTLADHKGGKVSCALAETGFFIFNLVSQFCLIS